jgi:hypothetical protein
MATELKRIVVYLTEQELAKVKDKADEKEQTVSAYARTRLGLKEKPRGAPTGNRNAAGKRQSNRKTAGKGQKTKTPIRRKR